MPAITSPFQTILREQKWGKLFHVAFEKPTVSNGGIGTTAKLRLYQWDSITIPDRYGLWRDHAGNTGGSYHL